ncbi:MAG: 4-hydroxythreonine-4-phosphate dehydrogenase PdxA [Candidatus Omnitrophota bacterium]
MPISLSGKKPLIIITIGHPTGIGPEVVIRSLIDKKIQDSGTFLIVGDLFTVDQFIQKHHIRFTMPVIDKDEFDPRLIRPGAIHLLDMKNVRRESFSYGSGDPEFGKASIEYIDTAIDLLAGGIGDALVTAPINKASVKRSGFRFDGHTEYLAHRTKTKKYAMMLLGGKLKVVPVTRHIPLEAVPRSIKQAAIRDAIELTYDALQRYFHVREPRIGVAGLNPHAGDEGHIGTEEKTIELVVRGLAKRMRLIRGPRPPDTIFYEAYNKKYDAVIAMYHDQGLIPLKMLYFNTGVNMTLGLPFVRTSPDHGTAFEIAGLGVADPDSMKEAIRIACSLARSGSR